jgi:cell division protein FtsL
MKKSIKKEERNKISKLDKVILGTVIIFVSVSSSLLIYDGYQKLKNEEQKRIEVKIESSFDLTRWQLDKC